MTSRTKSALATGRCARALLAFLLLLPTTLQAQGKAEDYARAERFLPWNARRLAFEAVVEPRWISGSQRFWYRKNTGEDKEFLLVDPEAKTRAAAFDHAKLAEGLGKAAQRQVQPKQLPFDEFEFTSDGAAIQFRVETVGWKCTLSSYECTRAERPSEENRRVTSPDGRWVASVRAHNLFVTSTATGQEIQLTRDGEPNYGYATPLPSVQLLFEQATGDVRQPAAINWSPDSKRLVTYRIDSRNAQHFAVTQFAPPNRLRPITHTYAYPLPGEAVSRAEPVIFEIDGDRVRVDTEPLEILFLGGPNFTWFRDSQRFQFVFTERGYQRVELREVDARTGKVRVLLEEKARTFIDPGKRLVRFINDGEEILWSSERDDWNHIYLYDGKTGQLKNQVTKGPWVVRSIVRVDDKARVLYFTAGGREAGEDPYQTHLYRINLDGTGIAKLTAEDASHAVQMSTSGAFFVDSYSRPDLPGKAVLRRSSDGQVVMGLEESDAKSLLASGYRPPEPFRGKARDGKTDIYGIIWRPSNFDPAKKYPVIEQIYTGPQSFFVPKAFAAYRNGAQAVAELGFVMVMIDGLGTAGRSKTFHDFCFKNLGDAGLEDHIGLLKQMAAKYSYMDLSRMGVYGTSAGGYAAAQAMLQRPEFYKVGVAISGNHDHRTDKAWWNELWMGYPVGENYVQQSNYTMAGKLEGRLLLVHGDMDDNVNVSATLQFADALMRANKDFDLLIVPNMRHGEGSNTYVIRRRWDYFVQHLLGVAPPKGYQIRRREGAAAN